MKRIFQSLVLLTVLLAGCIPAAGEDSPVGLELAPVPTEFAGVTNPFGIEAADAGQLIFQGYCASCHGDSGKGDGYAGASLEPKPRDLSLLSELAGDDFLFWRISKGSPGTAMIGWEGVLDADQIWQVVAFIRTLK